MAGLREAVFTAKCRRVLSAVVPCHWVCDWLRGKAAAKVSHCFAGVFNRNSTCFQLLCPLGDTTSCPACPERAEPVSHMRRKPAR
jgi:hypothetical protein